MNSLAAEVATAESLVERLAAEAQEEVSHQYGNTTSFGAISSLAGKKEN